MPGRELTYSMHGAGHSSKLSRDVEVAASNLAKGLKEYPV